MWFTEVTGSRIGRITAAGVVTEYNVSPASPQSIVSGPDGNLWFTSTYSVGRLTTAGVVTLREFLTTSSEGKGGTGITVGPNGEDIWFLDQSTNQVGRLSIAAGVVTNEYLVPTPGANLYGIAAGPDGNLWFTEYDTNKIGRITTAGSITEFPGPPYGCPRGIAAGPDGAMWFADCSGSIDRITTAGVITQYSSGMIIGADPIGIAQGPGGSIWFADFGNNAVGRVNLSNATITEYKAGISPNASVVAIAEGSAGMWFVENGYGRIGAITAPNPSFTSAGVVSAASFALGPVAPGEVVSIFGEQIGPTTPAVLTLDSTGKVATSIGGVSVSFGGHLAPLTYVGAGQINAIVPYEVAGSPSVGLTVDNNGFQSNYATVQLAATGPGIFTLNGSGTGPGAILNQDFSVNSQSNPALKGSVIQIYMTGEGVTTPTPADGAVTIATSAFPYTPAPQAAVSVTIGGQPAQLQWSGEAPDFVAGVLQVNATIPVTATSGANSIAVKIGSNTSQSGVTVWVK
jgi:uncharacterized protein (TIGR03437 family)